MAFPVKLLMSGRLAKMQELEKPYIKALIEHFKPVGDVLEIGFSEVSAEEVQKYQPKSHTIIENDPEVTQKARRISHLTIIEDSWKNALGKLGEFDAIIINGYPLASAQRQMLAITELQHAKVLLEEEKKIVKMVEEKIPDLTSIKYSDEDLDAFFAEADNEMYEELLRFLSDLKTSGQITEKQHQKCLKKYGRMKPESALISFWKNPSHFFEFFSKCLKKHLRKEGRLCCYIDKAASKYDDPQFFNQIITNPSLNYEEKAITVNSSEALMMMIQKL